VSFYCLLTVTDFLLLLFLLQNHMIYTQQQQWPKAPAHVLIFPFPAQGHVNSMLKLAGLLSLAGLHVTFLNTDFIQDALTVTLIFKPGLAAIRGSNSRPSLDSLLPTILHGECSRFPEALGPP
jgi:hypothetical protein